MFPKVSPADSSANDCYTLLPMALLAIAAPLEQRGFAVTIIDQRLENQWAERLRNEIASFPVLGVGISVMTGFAIKGALECAATVRAIAPQLPIIWGGVHPSLLPLQTIESPLVDILVVGEGEQTMVELVDALSGGAALSSIAGIVFKDDEGIKQTSQREPVDFATTPTPAYHLADIENYFHSPWSTQAKRPIAFITSRGCPWRCGYCYNLSFNDRRWNCWSAERVVEEMKRLIRDYRVDAFFLLDDNFFVKQSRVRSICELMGTRKIEAKILNANCRVDTLIKYDDELLKMMRDRGFDNLFLGLESGSQRVLDRIHKDIYADQAIEANKRLRRIGIVPVYSFMAGFPGEKVADIRATLSLMAVLRRDNPDAVINPINVFSPFPGTPLFDDCLAEGMRPPASLAEWAEFDYRYLNPGPTWSKAEERFLSGVHILSSMINPDITEGKNRFSGSAKSFYSRSLNWRLRRKLYFFPEMSWIRRRSRSRQASQGSTQ